MVEASNLGGHKSALEVEIDEIFRSIFEDYFLIGAHGMAIAGVFCAFEAANGGNVRAAPISFGMVAGIIMLDLMVWWGSLNAEPIRRQRLGNMLYWGGCIGGALLLVAGVFFVIDSGISQNPFWVFNVMFAAAVFWLPAFVCWKFGSVFRFILSAVEHNPN